MDIANFLKTKLEENRLMEVVKTEPLYSNIQNNYLKQLFAIMHQRFNALFEFMKSKKKGNGHFNASESRELLNLIKLYEDMHYVLRETPLSFKLDDTYDSMVKFCKGFLQESNGSEIPNDLPEFKIKEYEPIFFISQIISVPVVNKNYNYELKFIGEGSYAKVFKYKDTFYNKFFVLKRAKDDLNDKELSRFRLEFDTMKELKSPYVLDVYRYDDTNNEYYMEYADESLYDFIRKNNTKLSRKRRRGIAHQIFKGFSYIHSKKYLHRDISFTNILLQHYDNELSVVKISDFGLVKIEHSNLTSFGSEVKGSLNDSNLQFVGFANYNMEYETFALTRLIYYVMTGKYNLENIKNENIRNFVLKGIDPMLEKRYHSIDEMQMAFEKAFPLTEF